VIEPIDDVSRVGFGHDTEQVSHPAVVCQSSTMEGLGDVVGDRSPGEVAHRAGEPPVGTDQRNRDPPTSSGGLECRDGAGCDDVHGFGQTDTGRGDQRMCGVAVFDDGKRRIGEDTERNCGHPQESPEW